MESDPFQNFQHQQTQQQPNSGLMRYRSAPSSYFTNMLEKDIFDELLMNRPASPDMLSRLISGGFQRNSPANEMGHRQSELPPPAKPKVEVFQQNLKQEQEMTNYASQNYYQPSMSNQGMDYRTVNPLIGGGSNSGGLLRQSSSPAGFLNEHVEGFGVMRNLVGDSSFSPSGSRFSNQMTYLPRQQSGQMSPIAEIGSKVTGKNSPEGGDEYNPDFQLDHWDDSMSMSEGFGGLETGKDVEVEDGEGRISRNPPLLAHHLSLPNPKASTEMNSFLQFQDSVPCKVRAKRGFATHPRSIAERVRRTKISERIRKLQDLVPNMDKQTNTSDMLDLAVDYIKELQDQVKSLSDNRSKCVCSNKQML